MREVRIDAGMRGQRLDKFLFRYLPGAPHSLIYKQIRKKNITVDGKRADGNHVLQDNEVVQIFFSDETIRAFQSVEKRPAVRYADKEVLQDIRSRILYEDDEVLLINKPAGMLTQKATPDDYSLTDAVWDHLEAGGRRTKEDAFLYRPGPVNRLDRNTGGIVAFPLTLAAAHSLAEAFRERDLQKYYLALIHGQWDKDAEQQAYLIRDPETNTSRIVPEGTPDAVPVSMTCTVLDSNREASLMRIRLHTGRTHQIRAHMAFLGHPLYGDVKYGAEEDPYLPRQALHAWELVFPEDERLPQGIAGKKWIAPIPQDIAERIQQLGLTLNLPVY